MALHITSLLKRGREMDREAYQLEAGTKLGTLRAGNSGIMSREGDVAASCHRKTLLRQLGLEIDPPTDPKQIMFQLGYASEDMFQRDIEKTLPSGHVLLREEQIPIEWQTKNGTKVTGRPDFVVCETSLPTTKEDIARTILTKTADGILGRMVRPILGIELKSVHSVWTAREVVFNSTPKLSNIAQAAHYMWKLGIPYKLIYKSYSHLGQGMSWSDRMAGMFPKQGQPGSQFMEYNDAGKAKQVIQFEVVYDLEIDIKGRVKYKLEDADKWEYSLVTIGDIENYYEFVSAMAEKKDLGPRPMTLDAQGTKLGYTDCGFCPMKPVCDKYEDQGFDKWLEEIRKQVIKEKV